jgi:hypothetical protein
MTVVIAAIALNLLPYEVSVFIWTGLAAFGGTWRTR